MKKSYRKRLEKILELLIKHGLSSSATDKADYILDADAEFQQLKKMKE